MPGIEAKHWDKANETALLAKWRETNAYAFDANTQGKPVFSIDTPPPYVNSPIHMGHASTYTIMDFFARYKRMTGHRVLFPLGMDRNGLPIETAAEKKFGVRLHEVDREKFLEMCRAVLNESSSISVDSFYHLGHSYNSWKVGPRIGDMYETDSTEYRILTQDSFIDLWKKGLVYEDSRLNNYCPGCRTTLSDSEIVRGEKETFLNHIIFTETETNEKLIIATTRPELLCNTAVIIFNPSDKRYLHLEGKKARVPMYDMDVPILSHPMADPAFGTGLVYMSRSAGDTDAIRFLVEMGIETQSCIDETGRMTEVAGFLKGLKTKEAREKIMEMMSEKGLVVKQEKIMHSVPLCERSKDLIEFISMPELYVKQMHVKKEMLEIANDIHFHAPESRQILVDWINKVRIDWPVSRRRYYGTEIPLWYCTGCKHPYVPPKGKYYRPWKEKCPASKCEKCGNETFTGETRVFDTWFDSSNSAAYILGKGRHDDFFNANTPCTLRPQGKEIIRTWLYYSMLKHYLLHDQKLFDHAWINYHILDEKGMKMSKSVGNVIDPVEILKRFGAEPFRLWIALEGNLSSTDLSCSFERIDAAGKTLTKFWNVARFVSSFPKPNGTPQLQPLDEWVLRELSSVIDICHKGFENYDYHSPAVALRHFLWDTFASHYLELVKHRAYNETNTFTKDEQDAGLYTLHAVLETLLRLFAPIIPLFTAHVYDTLHGTDIHSLEYPRAEWKLSPLAFTTDDLEKLDSFIWKTKREKGGTLKTPLQSAVLHESFKPIEKDLRAAHSIQSLSYGNENQLTL
ncbi:MAG: valine--tRNA ligase [archaeon]